MSGLRDYVVNEGIEIGAEAAVRDANGIRNYLEQLKYITEGNPSETASIETLLLGLTCGIYLTESGTKEVTPPDAFERIYTLVDSSFLGQLKGMAPVPDPLVRVAHGYPKKDGVTYATAWVELGAKNPSTGNLVWGLAVECLPAEEDGKQPCTRVPWEEFYEQAGLDGPEAPVVYYSEEEYLEKVKESRSFGPWDGFRPPTGVSYSLEYRHETAPNPLLNLLEQLISGRS